MIVTLTGQNNYGLRAALDKLVGAFIAEHTDMGLERLDGEDAEFMRMQEALESLPFLVAKKLVVLRQPGANKQFTEQAERLLGAVPDSTDVVIVEPKLDKRTAYYKFLQKHTDFREFNELDESGLVRWAVQYAGDNGGTLGASDARFLVERVGASQQLLRHEIDKLVVYKPAITKDTIEQLVERTPQSTIFELLDAAFAGNASKAMRLYEEQHQLKVEPQQILALIGWQLHILAVVKAAGSRDPATIAREAKLNPFVVRKALATARGLSFAQVKRLVRAARQLDVRLKSESLDADDATRQFILALAVD